MLIISDTSAITNLIQIEQLNILKQLFGKVYIPKKVYQELSVYESQKNDIDLQKWLLVKTVLNQNEVKKIEKQLDPGEAEAIVLAKEMQANLLIIDERKGRKLAENYGLQIIGLLGILIQGRKNGYLKKLKPIL